MTKPEPTADVDLTATDEWQRMEREADDDIAAGRVTRYDSTEEFVAALEAAVPTVWSVTYPPEPGPEVTAVRDSEGDLWRRDGHRWRLVGFPLIPLRGWDELLDYEPLTDATHEPQEAT